MRWAFFIEAPITFSSIEKLAKKGKMAHTKGHPPKSIGRERPIFFSVMRGVCPT